MDEPDAPRWTPHVAAPRTSPALLDHARRAASNARAHPPYPAPPRTHSFTYAALTSLPRHANRLAEFGYDALTSINEGGPDAHTYPDTQPSRGRPVRPARRQARPAAGTRAAHDVVAAPGHAGHGAQAAEVRRREGGRAARGPAAGPAGAQARGVQWPRQEG